MNALKKMEAWLGKCQWKIKRFYQCCLLILIKSLFWSDESAIIEKILAPLKLKLVLPGQLMMFS